MQSKSNITSDEASRYSRHLLLPDFGEKELINLKNSSVVVIGLGGLGHPVVQYLSAAGVGQLTLVDHDRVELHNLARQVLFEEGDIGCEKADAVVARLSPRNHNVSLHPRHVAIDASNAHAICANHHLIIDCCDNLAVKYLLDKVASELSIPLLFGAATRFEGQVSVFHGHAGTAYIDVYPESYEAIPTCETAGIWGPTVAIIGGIMASEALSLLAKGKCALDGKLLQVDLRDYSFQKVKINRSPKTERTQPANASAAFQSIDGTKLHELMCRQSDTQLIDVRDNATHDTGNIGGICLPMDELLCYIDQLNKKATTILYCDFGFKSAQAALLLAGEGFENIYHLKGGLAANAGLSTSID